MPDFEIREYQDDGWLRLTVVGELDLGTTPVLEDRLVRLRAKREAVRLDLSELEFIDSTGLHLLIRALGDARIDGWSFDIDPNVPPRVMRLFKLVHFDRILQGEQTGSNPS